ncbi:hybrid sensor histidine kinase/response regulator [Janthinobacterium agaricidamnosum]|uniref:hybrid sensor histidine kinase/response regulator n=1 Tax=Janthinobacterium agaricidamnosum TaxID=55508 RepID=UPI000AEA3CCA|nr:ATP-binding protein [Janthinobacterium agaricidamnosum]
MFEHAACGLLLADANGNILRANSTLCHWLGYLSAELTGGAMRIQDLLTIGGRVFHQTHCAPMLQVQGSVAEVQFDLRHRNQSRIPMLINIVRRNHGGAIFDEFALFIATDRRSYERELLAARKAAEASLEAKLGAEAQLKAINQQLSAADRRKDEFLATLAHELRNPLAPMRSALEILKLQSQGEPTHNRVLGVFERQMQHMTHLIDDLMEVSRITQGRMALRRSIIDLASVMRAAAADVHDMIEAARHTLTISLPEENIAIDADATRLTQVIVNLLTNACKYTPAGGQIRLAAQRRDGYAVISVADSGIGIPPESLSNIFEMFSQLEPALERSKGGLGIGLALVRGLVALHGGTISADSQGAGLGSTFTVRLPLTDAAVDTDAAAAPVHEKQALRVMVVDDNIDAAETLTMALDLLGYQARNTGNAAHGLALAQEFTPHIALLDIGLPDMNGYELARRLRQTSWGAGMTLIAATGWGQDSDKQLALEAGFDHHLTKPIDFDQLQTLLGSQGC